PLLSSALSCTLPPPRELHTLSLHDALPICGRRVRGGRRARSGRRARVVRSGRGFRGHLGGGFCGRIGGRAGRCFDGRLGGRVGRDRKSTRLNSSYVSISYAVFCLKKKKRRT